MKSLQNAAIALLLAALAVNGCGRKPGESSANSLPPVAVRVQVAESKSRVATEDEVGTVRARLQSVIEAKVSGKIEQMLVAPGQNVKAGELLVQLDAREVQAQLDSSHCRAPAGRKRFETRHRSDPAKNSFAIRIRQRPIEIPRGRRGGGAGANPARLHQGRRAVCRRHHPQIRRRGRSRRAGQTVAGNGGRPRFAAGSGRAGSGHRPHRARRQIGRARRPA